jgi:uncharacterized membrane protein YeiH
MKKAGMRYDSDDLLLHVDLAGTAIFALEGALAAIHAQLDFFGVMVLSFVTALAGGVIRDVLIGAVPPASLRDWRYATTAFIAGSGAFFFYRLVAGIPGGVLTVLDAAGLGLFAVAGTQKALDFRMPSLIAVLLGTITGVGGGTVRDVLLAQVPTVLRSEVYATAALAGSVLMVAMRRWDLPPRLAAFAGGALCFGLRVVSVWRHWNLPRAGG